MSEGGERSQPQADGRGQRTWICPRCRASYGAFQERCDTDGWRLVQNLAGLDISGRYRLDRLIGVGGMDGTVWRALQHPTEREVAVKLLPSSDAASLQRFERGAKLASQLNHPNITTIHDYGQTGEGQLYLAMELLEGRTLASHIKRTSVDVREALHISAQILRAIEHAHAKQVVHRDLKPANVFLTRKNDDSFFVKILDFGIAKQVGNTSAEESFGPPQRRDDDITQAHQICGTPEYMAPEQILGGPAEPRSDIYALGVIMYRLFAGSLPFQGHTRHELYHRHLHEPPKPFPAKAGVPEAIERVVMKALAKNPADRYTDAAEMRQALTEAGRQSSSEMGVSLSGVFTTDGSAPKPTNTAPAPAPPPPERPRRKGWLLVAALAVLVAAILVPLLLTSSGSDGGLAQAPTAPVPTSTAATNPPVSSPAPAPGPTAAMAPAPAAAPPVPAPSPAPAPTEAVVEPSPAPAPTDVAPAPTTGRLVLSGAPAGAEVVEGERVLGTLPLDVELPTGRHHLVVRATGHADLALTIDTASGVEARETITLARAATRVGRASTARAREAAPTSPTNATGPAGPTGAAGDEPPSPTGGAPVDPGAVRPRLLGSESRPRILGQESPPPVRLLDQK